MDFALSPDQESLRSSVRDMLQAECPPALVRRSYDEGGFDEKLWAKVSDLGWLGLTVPEDAGGIGLGWVEATLLGEEMGRALFPGPYLAQLAAISLAKMAPQGHPFRDLLPALASGQTLATVALFEGRSTDVQQIGTKASSDGQGYVLDGVKLFVPDGDSADVIFVSVQTDRGPAIALVEAGETGLAVDPLPIVDRTRPLSALRMSAVVVPTQMLIEDASPLLERLRDRLTLFLAAEQAGISRVCMEMSIAYAKTRQQFDKPIGVYQAVSHKIADMFTASEHASSLVRFAAWAADEAEAKVGDDEIQARAATAAWRAKLWASQASERTTADAIQVHGGIGFTWEHDLHMFFKRARANTYLMDEPHQLRDLLSRQVHSA